MELIYNNKKITIIECKSFISRLKGFMFQKEITNGLLFNHCNSIHTFFMKSNIDVIMCDKDNKILYYYKNLNKRKIILPKSKVTKTIELPINYFNFTIGDSIKIKK